ncbi:hypothetical protein ACG7TL_005302 [Trametes sanguinea]
MPASPSSSKFRAPPSPASATSQSDLAPHHHSLRQDAKHIASEVKRRVSRLFHSKHHHHHTQSSAGSGVVKVLADGIYHTLSDPIFSSHPHGAVHAPDSTPTKRDLTLPESPSGYSDSGDSTLSSISDDFAQTGRGTGGTDPSPSQRPHVLPEEPKVDRTQADAAPALPVITLVEDESTIERPASWTGTAEEGPRNQVPLLMRLFPHWRSTHLVSKISALLLETEHGSELLLETSEHGTSPSASGGEADVPELVLGSPAPTSGYDTSATHSATTDLPSPVPGTTSPRSSPESTPYAQRRPSLPFTPRMPGLYRWPTPGPAASVGDIEADRDDDVHSVYLPVLDLLRMFVPIPNIRFRFILKFLLMWWLF